MIKVAPTSPKGISASGWLAVLLLVTPWVQSFSFGPSHVVPQSLITWALAIAWWSLSAGKASPLPNRVEQLALGWGVAAVLSAGIGLLQYFGAAGAAWPIIASADIGQAYGNLRQRNQLATLLNMGLASLIWYSVQKTEISKSTRHVLLLSTAALSIANAATNSRTGIAELILLVALGLGWRRGQKILLISVVSYVLAAIVLPLVSGADIFTSGILGRVVESSPVCTSRITLWSNVLHIISLRPWLGWGWGELSFAHFMTLYPGQRFCEILDNAHNLPLHFAVELGIPFAILFCSLCVWQIVRGRPWAATNASCQMAWSVLAVIGLHSLLEYPLWYAPFQLAVLLCFWILWSNLTESGPYRAKKWLRVLIRSGQAAILSLCAYTAWDYWRISQIYLSVEARNVAYRDDTLEKIRASRIFQSHVKFAELSVTPITQNNAERFHSMALALLHFSPEPRVVEAVIESSEMMGYHADAVGYRRRFEAAYPEKYAEWNLREKPVN